MRLVNGCKSAHAVTDSRGYLWGSRAVPLGIVARVESIGRHTR